MFNGSHYELIRNCPEYRTACMLEDLRLELEPAWAQPEEVHHYHANVDLRNRISTLEEDIKRLSPSKKKSTNYIYTSITNTGDTSE